MISYALDRESLEEIAQAVLERPSDAMFWDDRLFTTHGAVLHWAERGDDLVEESNYLTALELIRGAADDGRYDTEVSDAHVIDGTSSHWLVGSVRTIYVQVYEDDVMHCRECDEIAAWAVSRKKHGRRRFLCDSHKDRWDGDTERYGLPALPSIKYRPKFTAAFKQAAEIITALQGYPVLDDSDYSEREYERWHSNVNEALSDAQGEYEHDTEEQTAEIADRCDGPLSDLYGHLPDGAVDWGKVAEIYREVRDAYFTELANAHLNAPIEGQLALVHV